MPIDYSIYQNAPKSILNYGLQGYGQAMQDRTADLQRQGLMSQNQQSQLELQQKRTDFQRQQDFRKALGDLLKVGGNFNTPDGQQAILTGLQQKGFGQEAIELAQHLPKPPPNAYDFLETPGGWASGNKQTGEMKVNAGIPSTKQEEKLAEDKFTSMKGTLDKIMTPPPTGWDPLKGEKANALSRAIAYMPADVLKSKVAQDWISNNKSEQQNTVFNPMMGAAMLLRPEMTAENRISGQNQKQTGDYEIAKRGALGFKADYENYKKAIASGDTQAIKVAQQGMVDKYITTSTGKSTGEAQFKNFIDGQGITNAMQNLGDKLVNGSMAPEKVFDAMNDITMSTALKMNDKTKQANAMTRKQVEKENKSHGFGIDPEALITHPEDMLTQDSAAFAQKPNAAAASPEKVARAKQYLALPANSPYRTPAHDAAAKAILGIP